ncbi:MAG TPA: hypothetical protein VI776_03870 [Anaerolineales bacterium]|nr:hypothetical protein [Anaerolineales bacterium]
MRQEQQGVPVDRAFALEGQVAPAAGTGVQRQIKVKGGLQIELQEVEADL